VVDVATSLAKEVLIVAPSEDEAQALRLCVPSLPCEALHVLADAFGNGSELTMIETGLEKSSYSQAIVLPGDAPFLSLEILNTMVGLCRGRDAVVPRSPTGEALPFPAAYATEKALIAIRASKVERASGMKDTLKRLAHVMFLSSSILQQLDGDLLTFFSVDSPLSLKRAEMILSGKSTKVRKTNRD
jgi:molybdopterin-guanine dinucleotide biosynthesis protein A